MFTYSLEEDGQNHHHRHPTNNNNNNNNTNATNNNNTISQPLHFSHASHHHHPFHHPQQQTHEQHPHHHHYPYIPNATNVPPTSDSTSGPGPGCPALPQEDPQLSLICVIMNIWRLQSFLDNFLVLQLQYDIYNFVDMKLLHCIFLKLCF